jgi:hypothetical protein
MFVPPVQAHVDAVIFADVLDNHTEELNDHHQEEHHQNDSEEHKNTEHHHHCTTLGFSSAFIAPLITYSNVIGITQEKKLIHFYQKSFLSNYLDTLLEPPRAC